MFAIFFAIGIKYAHYTLLNHTNIRMGPVETGDTNLVIDLTEGSIKMRNKDNGSGVRRSRKTVGLISRVSYMTVEGYEGVLFSGVLDAAREYDVNLICFAGGLLDDAFSNEYFTQRNFIYELPCRDNVDGLIIVSGTMVGHEGGQERLQAFCESFRPLPMVSIGLPLADIPSILVDNVTGLDALISHLVEEHGYHRIAFIRGPHGHAEANQRFQAYRSALEKHGLSLQDHLVTPGNFLPDSGMDAIRLLIDERKLKPKIDFDALIAANDNMAFSALEALQARGFSVPYDVAVVGFDDISEARVFTPPLTTVRQPIGSLGSRALETLLAIFAGKATPKTITLPTELVQRQSCGCVGQSVRKADIRIVPGQVSVSNQDTLGSHREHILQEMTQEAAPVLGSDARARCEKLVNAFIDDLQGTSDRFLQSLDACLRVMISRHEEVGRLHDVFSVMRRLIISHLSVPETLMHAENLFHQARVMIGGVASRNLAHQRIVSEERSRHLNTISQDLLTMFDMSGLVDIILQEIPHLGINRCYVALYDSADIESSETDSRSEPALGAIAKIVRPKDHRPMPEPPERSRLILAYDQSGCVSLEDGGHDFPTRQLIPRDLITEERHALMAIGLYFREELFGYVLFGLEAFSGTGLYETLRLQISSALKGARLFQERRTAEARVQKELKEKDALLKEIYHRVKNNLNIVASLLHLQSGKIQSKEQALDAFRESRERILSMALVHQKLYGSESLSRIDMKSYVNTMVRELFHAYDVAKNVALHIQIDDIFLDINAAIPCGLILNELVTNVFKYAFPQGRKGNLHISMKPGQGDSVELIVRDDGVGLPRDFELEKSQSLGLQLVNVLTEQLDGTLHLKRTKGARFIIRFPLNYG